MYQNICFGTPCFQRTRSPVLRLGRFGRNQCRRKTNDCTANNSEPTELDNKHESDVRLSRHKNVTQIAEKGGKRQRRKEKAGCGNLPHLADSVRLATPLARFSKVGRTASKQRVECF